MNEPNPNPNQAVAVRESFSIMQGAGRVEELVGQIQLIQQVMSKTMVEGEHYGVTPGCNTKKPTLFKAGAEKLAFVFRLSPEYKITTRDVGNGHRDIEIVCTLRQLGSGVFMGEGVGCCSTMEAKYRFRTGPKKSTGQPVPKGYWDLKRSDPAEAQKQIGGKGFSVAKDADGQWEIVEQGEKCEHDNPADYYNTVLKMSKKRAMVDAVLTATAASDCFIQDLEPEEIDDDSKLPQEKQVNGTTRNTEPTSDNDGMTEWRDTVIHFGEKSKGKKLGDLDQSGLTWWITKWVPKPYPEGSKTLKGSDHFLRQQLDMAGKELNI